MVLAVWLNLRREMDAGGCLSFMGGYGTREFGRAAQAGKAFGGSRGNRLRLQ